MESAGFLTMHRFGPFMTYDRDHMEKLSGALKVIVKHIWTFSPGPEPSSTPMPLAAQRAAMRADSPLRGRPRPEADHPHHVQRSSSESSPSPNGGGVSINEDMPIRRKLFPAEGEGHGGRRGRLETSARDAPARPQKSPAPHEQRKDSPRGQSKQGP